MSDQSTVKELAPILGPEAKDDDVRVIIKIFGIAPVGEKPGKPKPTRLYSRETFTRALAVIKDFK